MSEQWTQSKKHLKNKTFYLIGKQLVFLLNLKNLVNKTLFSLSIIFNNPL